MCRPKILLKQPAEHSRVYFILTQWLVFIQKVSVLPYRWAEPWWGWAGRSPLWSWRCTCRCRSSRNGTSHFGSAEGGSSLHSGHRGNSGGRSRESSNLEKEWGQIAYFCSFRGKENLTIIASSLWLNREWSIAHVLFVLTHFGFWGEKIKTSFTILTWSHSQRSHLRSPTLFDESHLAWRAFLPQTKAVAALATSDGGVLRWDPTFTPCHSLHLPLLLLVCEGTFPFLTLCCCEKMGDSQRTSVSFKTRAATVHLKKHVLQGY